jgi:hypothetical protein
MTGWWIFEVWSPASNDFVFDITLRYNRIAGGNGLKLCGDAGFGRDNSVDSAPTVRLTLAGIFLAEGSFCPLDAGAGTSQNPPHWDERPDFETGGRCQNQRFSLQIS